MYVFVDVTTANAAVSIYRDGETVSCAQLNLSRTCVCRRYKTPLDNSQCCSQYLQRCRNGQLCPYLKRDGETVSCALSIYRGVETVSCPQDIVDQSNA